MRYALSNKLLLFILPFISRKYFIEEHAVNFKTVVHATIII